METNLGDPLYNVALGKSRTENSEEEEGERNLRRLVVEMGI